MNAKIINREYDESAQAGWYQIEVSGEHPAGSGRRQVVDGAAISSIVTEFNRRAAEENFPGLLVDADHLSHEMDQKTEAYGWLKELRKYAGELEGRIEWTDLGEAAILCMIHRGIQRQLSAKRSKNAQLQTARKAERKRSMGTAQTRRRRKLGNKRQKTRMPPRVAGKSVV